MSSLAALEAENRAAYRRGAGRLRVTWRGRPSNLPSNSAGYEAFLYSCLVAAVGAVDEHAKSTLDGLKDPGKAIREIGSAGNTGNGTSEGAMAAASDVDAGPHAS